MATIALHEIVDSRESQWASDHYKSTLQKLVQNDERKSLLEIGGGRHPLFTPEEIMQLGIRYTVNDISAAELERIPEIYNKACFDISATIPEQHEHHDLIFSRMVFEHVKDVEQAYQNVYQLLSKGGICINFHPTLYSPPFVLNQLLPERFSRKILAAFFKGRNDDHYPKFPAYYHWCYSTEKVAQKLRGIGFKEVHIAPFYGHSYFQKIPIIRTLDDKLSQWANRKDIRLLSSYAFTIVKK